MSLKHTTVTPKMMTKTSEPTPITITTMAHWGINRSSSATSTFVWTFLAMTVKGIFLQYPAKGSMLPIRTTEIGCHRIDEKLAHLVAGGD